jgi:cation diffusion facilitator CzcD-associated flavoprotein CzcO
MTAAKLDHAGNPTFKPERPFDDCSEEEKIAILDRAWSMGGFSFLGSTFREFAIRKDVNAYMYDYWKMKVRAKMTDPVKMDIVAPMQQRNYIGIKRPSLEMDYYETLDRPNVDIVDLKATPIKEFTEKGIVTDREREFDIIILATGYDSMTGSLMDLNIKDISGELLQKKWSNGVKTHLGMMIPGLPNMFMVYSPQSPGALATGPSIIESQVEWTVKAIQKMKKEGIHTLDSTHEAARAWKDSIQVANEYTFYPHESTWYMGDNIPGKPREQLVYIMGLPNFIASGQAALDTWDGFIVQRTEEVKLNDVVQAAS